MNDVARVLAHDVGKRAPGESASELLGHALPASIVTRRV